MRVAIGKDAGVGSKVDRARLAAWLGRPVGGVAVLLFWLVVSFMLWANIARQSTDYGTNYGRFADQVDSFSEYLVRNSVIDRVRSGDPDPGYLVYTPGFEKGEYGYTPGPTRRYYSNRAIQAVVFAWIGGRSPEFFLDHQAGFFQLFRLVNSMALAAAFLVFFVGWLGRNRLALGMALAMTLSGGACLFASNLYFMAWVMFSPLLCYPLVKRGSHGWYCLAAGVCSLAYFAMRYEFATTFALLWILPFLIRGVDGERPRWGFAALAFLCSCTGFAIALWWHHMSVAAATGGSLADASRLIFVTLETRVASLTNVPAPFSPAFFWSLLKRWSWAGFVIPLLAEFSKLAVLIAFLALWHRFRRSRPSVLLAIWAVVTYLSWYLFSYQHIMLHLMYDSLIFAATVQLATVIFAALALRGWLGESRRGNPLETPAAKADVGGSIPKAKD